jgi:hypothetical protein
VIQTDAMLDVYYLTRPQAPIVVSLFLSIPAPSASQYGKSTALIEDPTLTIGAIVDSSLRKYEVNTTTKSVTQTTMAASTLCPQPGTIYVTSTFMLAFDSSLNRLCSFSMTDGSALWSETLDAAPLGISLSEELLVVALPLQTRLYRPGTRFGTGVFRFLSTASESFPLLTDPPQETLVAPVSLHQHSAVEKLQVTDTMFGYLTTIAWTVPSHKKAVIISCDWGVRSKSLASEIALFRRSFSPVDDPVCTLSFAMESPGAATFRSAERFYSMELTGSAVQMHYLSYCFFDSYRYITSSGIVACGRCPKLCEGLGRLNNGRTSCKCRVQEEEEDYTTLAIVMVVCVFAVAFFRFIPAWIGKTLYLFVLEVFFRRTALDRRAYLRYFQMDLDAEAERLRAEDMERQRLIPIVNLPESANIDELCVAEPEGGHEETIGTDGSVTRRRAFRMCSNCTTRRANAVFLPCGHEVWCMRCVRQSIPKQCPTCEAKVESTLKSYFT